MPDVRDQFSRAGVRVQTTPYKFDSTIVFDRTKTGGASQVGLAVTMAAADDTVTLAGDGDIIVGKLISVEPGMCVVQTGGFCALPGGNGATLTVGSKIIGAVDASSNKGFVKALPETVTTPTAAEVANAFKAAKTRGIIRNNDVTTAVSVELI